MPDTESCDVLIAGGGPAGSTLAALLAQRTELSVRICEQDRFPREHIGESYTQRVASALAESGALSKVLASDCWVRKYGGIYAWDDAEPAVSLFEHRQWENDEILRWTVHADRAEFDSILLEHARACGAVAEEGIGVTGAQPEGDGQLATLSDGRQVRCRIFIEATGRQTRLVGERERRFLSSYRNIALWTHVTGGQLTQSLPGDWNIFRRLGASAIGSFAFDNGWFWYIPVPRVVDGRRVLTHSLGMVTDPRVLKESDYTDIEMFMKKARSVPLLGELVAHARPTYGTLQRATNYSMMSEAFCDFDERWILLGDSAFFVDPLFSSGVAFATAEATVAARMIEATLCGTVPAEHQRDLWHDYDQRWHLIGRSFALMIDQWYHAIANAHPDSVYWQSRVEEPTVDLRRESFHGLVDTDISPDLLLVVAKNRSAGDVKSSGPLASLQPPSVQAAGRVRLEPQAQTRDSFELHVGRSRQAAAEQMVDRDAVVATLARYWSDPVRHVHEVPSICPPPSACRRLTHCGDLSRPSVTHTDTPELLGLVSRLQAGGETYAALADSVGPAGKALLEDLSAAEMITSE